MLDEINWSIGIKIYQYFLYLKYCEPSVKQLCQNLNTAKLYYIHFAIILIDRIFICPILPTLIHFSHVIIFLNNELQL